MFADTGRRSARGGHRLQPRGAGRGGEPRRPRGNGSPARSGTPIQRGTPFARPPWRADAPSRSTDGGSTVTDPTDKLLVEAVLSRPRRAKDDLEAARLASMRPNRVAVPPVEEDEDEEESEDLLLTSADALAEAADLGVEVVGEDGQAPGGIPLDAPAKLDAVELEEPTQEELEALSADMIGIDD